MSSLALPPAELLSASEMFTGISREGVAKALQAARLRSFSPGGTIFVQGDKAERAHLLLSGRVRIAQGDAEGGQVLLRFVGPGQMYGALALFTSGRYPAHASAVGACTEASWSEDDLRGLMASETQLAINLIIVAAQRLAEMQERLREIATQRVDRRIAHVLLRLADQAGDRESEGVAISFPLGRKDLAEMCGATLHTVSRTLTAWEKAGLLATQRQRITIKDGTALRRVAQDAP